MNTVYDTLLVLIDQLCTQYPEYMQKTAFGKSYIGRSIPALQLGDGNGHRLLYIGGITGSITSGALLLRFARDYAEAVSMTDSPIGGSRSSGGRIAGIDISYLLHTRTITVVPLLNPDGAVLRHHGDDPKNPLLDRLRACRSPYTESDTDAAEHPFSDLVTNGRGVDLRANCDADFDECIRTSRGIGIAGFPGMHPESEPECAAVCRYLRALPVTDLTLLFDDEDSGSPIGRLTYAGSGVSCGGDRRVAGIASILARDIDGGNCMTGISETPGSFELWYRTLGAGPMLRFAYPGLRSSDSPFLSELRSPEAVRALLYTAAGYDDTDPAEIPGHALDSAEFALVYAKIRQALFHGTVL